MSTTRCRFSAAARELAEHCAEHVPSFEPDTDTALGFLDDGVISAYAQIEPDLVGEAVARIKAEDFWADFGDGELLGARVRNAVYGYVAEALASEAQEIEVAA